MAYHPENVAVSAVAACIALVAWVGIVIAN